VRKDSVADEIVRAFDLDVVDLFIANKLNRDDAVPEDRGQSTRNGLGVSRFREQEARHGPKAVVYLGQP